MTRQIHALAACTLAAACAFGSITASAQTTGAPRNAPATAERSDRSLLEFTQRFKAQNPGTRIDAVSHSPISGLYEVVMGKNVAYTDQAGRYVLFGHVWDMESRRDLTADRKAAIDRVDVASLPVSLALRHVHGKGTRVLYAFADPQCGYCKQLEQALQGLEDATVYTFMLPVLGAESKRLALNVACSADPARAWSDWMLRGQAPVAAGPACTPDIDAVEKIARELGIDATPTLISADGRKNAGAMSTSQLNAWLSITTPALVAATPVRAAAPR